MTLRQLRALRGVSAAGLTTLLAAVAHTLGGGGAPSPVLLLAVALLAAPLCLVLVGRRLSVWGLALAVAVGQALFHLAFAITATAGTATHAGPGHAHHGLGAISPGAGAPALAVDPQMIAHHLGAALVTVVLLHRGERMLRAVARGIAALLPAVLRTPVLEVGIALRPIALTPASPQHPLFASDARRRGPPSSE